MPFFGRDAMTTPAAAAFAQRMRVPIAAGKVERLRGADFRITAYRVEQAETGDRRADIAETTRRINALFEEWIRERPDLWFWVHRRWLTHLLRMRSEIDTLRLCGSTGPGLDPGLDPVGRGEVPAPEPLRSPAMTDPMTRPECIPLQPSVETSP